MTYLSGHLSVGFMQPGPGTQEISYGTCESAGEKAIGLDQDKRKNLGGGRVKQTNPKAKPA